MSENQIVVLLGVSTVFIGLISLVILCKILGKLCNNEEQNISTKTAVITNPITTAISTNQTIENKQQIIAAVSAAIAEELGTDISAIRILSFKKI